MCGIAGFIGEGALPKLLKMLRILEHRGPDATRIYYKKADPAHHIHGFKGDVAIGHKILITDKRTPPIGDQGIIVCDGRIYNPRTESASKLISDSIREYGVMEALRMIMDKFDGDYSFAFFDGEDIILARDPIGIKPLYYKLGKDFIAFASERKALWGIGIQDPRRLPPGTILINRKIIRLKRLPEKIETKWDYNTAKERLGEALERAVRERIQDLERVGILFSGGVDSTLITLLVKKYAEPILYTVGSKGSQDLIFAEKAAQELGIEPKIIKVTPGMIKDALKPVLSAIEEFNVMKIGVAMPLYFASKAAHADGIRVIVSGQGADELFGGYHRYLQLYKEGEDKLIEAFKTDIQEMYHVNLERDDATAMATSTELRVPFLDKEIINIAFNIPIEYKIKGSDDSLRKHILRDLALDMGAPAFIAKRPKKAAQYGSGIDKILRRSILPGFDHKSFMENLRMGFYKGYHV